jgi:hypothetical protein
MKIFYYIVSVDFMRANIPRPIRVDVIRKWLRGKSRDQIAKEEGIGAGTVSSIIKECRQHNDPEFDLLRQVAADLKSQGYSVESFAPLIRLREILRRELLLLPHKTTGSIKIAGGQEHPDDEEEDSDLKTILQLRREELELEEKLESILQALLVFCFKQNLSITDFIEVICLLCRAANSFGISLENLAGYVRG